MFTRKWRLVLIGLALPAMLAMVAAQQRGAHSRARWIWSDPSDPAPKNRFTYFRKVIELDQVPSDAKLLFAADSNAALWINGHPLRRKVSRYHEEKITAEAVNAGPFLKEGKNVVLVRHHNWGGIVTFQRDANRHAGLYLDSSWSWTGEDWRWRTAPQYLPHEKQIVGVIGDPRIRYSQIIDGRDRLPGDLHSPDYDDSGWQTAAVVEDGPWPEHPNEVETPAQREYRVRVQSVVAAGRTRQNEEDEDDKKKLSNDPFSMAHRVRTAAYLPDWDATDRAHAFIAGEDLAIEGEAGESHYVTFDFHRPVHGYPYLELADASSGVRVDLGYGELAYAQYDAEMHVKPNGWINPEGVVGEGYADRYITREGAQRVEIPDERTARWLAVHVHFPEEIEEGATGKVVFKNIGIVQSQYPVRPVGSFATGHNRMDQLVKLALIHAEVTMSDAYIDTPGREDGQWIEDAQLRAVIAARWFGDTRLRDLMLRTIAESQGEDGNFHPFPPSNYDAYPAPFDWSVQWAAILYDDYLWSGETENIRRYWDVLVRYWDGLLEHLGEDGVWRSDKVLADLRVGVHPEDETESSGIVTAFLIERLRWSAEMAGAIGESEQAGKWRAAEEKMAAAFVERHLAIPGEGLPRMVADRLDPDDPEAERGFSQAGQTAALRLGLLEPDHVRAILDYAFPPPDGSPPEGVTRWNNPPYSYRVARVLSEWGRADRAVAHILERYAPYLPFHPRNLAPLELQGPFGGPLPEYWVSRRDLGLPVKNEPEPEPNTAQPEDETGSHGWGAMPLLWMHDTLLGVRIAEPGGGTLRIAPLDGGLPYVSGHTMTPKGLVYVHWDPQQFVLQIELPADVEADVTLPDVTGRPANVLRAAGEVRREGPRSFQVEGAGSYEFRVE